MTFIMCLFLKFNINTSVN